MYKYRCNNCNSILYVKEWLLPVELDYLRCPKCKENNLIYIEE